MANEFATTLLVPAYMLKRYKDFASIQELSKIFCVSEDVIMYRLNRL